MDKSCDSEQKEKRCDVFQLPLWQLRIPEFKSCKYNTHKDPKDQSSLGTLVQKYQVNWDLC